MVAKEKMLIFIATVIVIFIIVALVFPTFSDMLPLENPFLQGKDAFVRYYACSLAICTQGCTWLSSNDICLKRNIWGNCTMTCKTEICDKQPFGNCGNKGMCCNDTYSIYLSLKGNAKFWSKVIDAREARLGLIARTEIDTIMNNFNKNEKQTPIFPEGFSIMSTNCPWAQQDNFLSASLGKTFGMFYKMGNDDPSQIRDWSQTGAIYMLPDQADPQFTCMDYNSRSGYSECTFKGYLQIYSYDPNKDNCADVVVMNGQEPYTGDFAFYAANNGKVKIAIDHTDAIPLYILNGLGMGMSETFTIKLQTPLPAGITCDFNGQDQTQINVQDTKVDSVPLSCTPIVLPPPGGFEVWVKAWDGTKTHGLKLTIDVGDFDLKLISQSPLIINAGNTGSFIFNLANNLGKQATFQLTRIQRLTGTQSIDNNVGCTLSDGSVTVDDGSSKLITLTCTPNSNAAINYDIDVTAAFDTVERTATAKVQVPSCRVTNLALKFLDSAGMGTTTVESGDAVKLKADGFSGCQNMNVRFMLSVGSKILYQNTVGASGDFFYSNFFTANSPDKWEMYVQMDENNDGIYEKESPRKNLTINAKGPPGYNTIPDQNSACAYAIGEETCYVLGSTNICDQCDNLFHPVKDCTNCLDPQSCFNTKSYYASASNVCCIKNSDTFSPGLTDAPCLSPDTNTHNDQTPYIQWKEVENPRNVLVKEPDREYAYTAKFNYLNCGGDANCRDSNGFIDAVCDEFDSIHPGKECKINGMADVNWYSSWMLIRISDDSNSRPVYGVNIKVGVNSNGEDILDASWSLYVHTKGGGGRAWTYIGSPWIISTWSQSYCQSHPTECLGYHFNEYNFKPTSGLAWKNIDALLIAFGYGYAMTPPTWSYTREGYIDYVGLLTNDVKNISYCTDGPGGATSPSTYRTVDNGKTCYWGVDCDTATGNGWTAPNDYSYIGPFKDISLCDCETDADNCGDGVCGPVNINGQSIRFDNVKCVYGGWMGKLVKI
jgi:hypothetical protein